MGNTGCQECSDSRELFSKTLGKIVFDPKLQIRPELIIYYEIEETSDVKKIKSIMEYWTKINNLKCEYIIKPLKIDPYEEKGVVFKNYSMKVYFNSYSFPLNKFMEENMKVNPILPEIQILNLISTIVIALKVLKDYNMPHFNISPDTIFLENSGSWVLTPPNIRKINLFERKDEGELIDFLIPPEITTDLEKTYSFRSDLYCLGITILHCIYPFHRFYMDKILPQSEINKKFAFIESYYSPLLVDLIKFMAQLDINQRKDIDFILQFLMNLQK